jgi:hypothetical protein
MSVAGFSAISRTYLKRPTAGYKKRWGVQLFWKCLLVQTLCWCLVSPRCGMTRLSYCFWGPQILEILEYSSGLKHGPASILNQNPIFEMASI